MDCIGSRARWGAELFVGSGSGYRLPAGHPPTFHRPVTCRVSRTPSELSPRPRPVRSWSGAVVSQCRDSRVAALSQVSLPVTTVSRPSRRRYRGVPGGDSGVTAKSPPELRPWWPSFSSLPVTVIAARCRRSHGCRWRVSRSLLPSTARLRVVTLPAPGAPLPHCSVLTRPAAGAR